MDWAGRMDWPLGEAPVVRTGTVDDASGWRLRMTESGEAPPLLLRRLVGDALRGYRVRQGRTLRDVAGAARVSVPYLSEVERGRKEASSEVLAAVCRGLDLRLSDLLEQVRRELLAQETRPRQPVRPAARPVAGPAAPGRLVSGPTPPVTGPSAAVRPAAGTRPASPAVPVRTVRAAEHTIPAHQAASPAQQGPTCQLGATHLPSHVPPAGLMRALRRRRGHGRPDGLGPHRGLAPIVPTAPGRPPARPAGSRRPAGQRPPAHRRTAAGCPGTASLLVGSPAARARVVL